MKIGIDASRAFLENRTGIEEYSYQVIKHLILLLKNDQVVLYTRFTKYEFNTNLRIANNFKLPENWKIKIIRVPYFWTQIGLSLELLFHPVDALFIPAHIVPIIHPKNTVVTIHGLEYEFCPEAYSLWARLYMRWAIRRSCRVAKKIIAVSENTKRDLINLYTVPENKISVIYEGVNKDLPLWKRGIKGDLKNLLKSQIPLLFEHLPLLKGEKYLLFIGRLEERKNICGIVEAFKILKEKYKIPHKLILAGKFGYGAERIKKEIGLLSGSTSLDQNDQKRLNLCRKDIILTGFINEEEKWKLFKNADVFLFPTFYEGFGLPILEAQAAGVPVVASNNSSVPEVIKLPLLPLGEGTRRVEDENVKKFNLPHPNPLLEGEGDNLSALLVNPNDAEEIAEAAYKIMSDEALRNDIIKKGHDNIKRFSWEKCAVEINKLFRK